MAAFPALIPSGRTFTPGSYGNTAWPSLGGTTTRSSHTAIITGQQVGLVFQALDQSDYDLIESHWIESRGMIGTFLLPAETWSGTASPAVFTPAGCSWRYTRPPSVAETPIPDASPPAVYVYVRIELEMVPEVAEP
jgi:hypothetical protein